MVGGYQIVDFSGFKIDASGEPLVGTITIKGIYDLLYNCNKPIMITGVTGDDTNSDDPVVVKKALAQVKQMQNYATKNLCILSSGEDDLFIGVVLTQINTVFLSADVIVKGYHYRITPDDTVTLEMFDIM